jgi:predicted NBD/HSP70 family sugar kinase
MPLQILVKILADPGGGESWGEKIGMSVSLGVGRGVGAGLVLEAKLTRGVLLVTASSIG